MEVEYDKSTDVTKAKLTRDEIRRILCGETVTDRSVPNFEIGRIDDDDAIKRPLVDINTWRVIYGTPTVEKRPGLDYDIHRRAWLDVCDD